MRSGLTPISALGRAPADDPFKERSSCKTSSDVPSTTSCACSATLRYRVFGTMTAGGIVSILAFLNLKDVNFDG